MGRSTTPSLVTTSMVKPSGTFRSETWAKVCVAETSARNKRAGRIFMIRVEMALQCLDTSGPEIQHKRGPRTRIGVLGGSFQPWISFNAKENAEMKVNLRPNDVGENSADWKFLNEQPNYCID